MLATAFIQLFAVDELSARIISCMELDICDQMDYVHPGQHMLLHSLAVVSQTVPLGQHDRAPQRVVFEGHESAMSAQPP